MKSKILIGLFLAIYTAVCIGQEVTLESEPMTAEEVRTAKIRAEISKIEDEYSKSWEQFEKAFYQLRPIEVVLNPTREKLDKKIQDIEQTLYKIQQLGLKVKCKQLNTLNNSIGETGDNCSPIKNRIKRLDERHREVRNEIAKLEGKKGDENTEKTLSFESNARDDFWNGIDKEAEKKETKNNDDFWNGNENKPDTNNDDDFWNGNENTSEAKSDFWNTGSTVEEQIQSLKDLAKKSGDQYIGEKVVKDKSIIVKYRDHGKIDGDRVRITQNDKLIRSNVTLKSSFSSVKIDLKKGINKIMFEALNEGSAGSNTAEFEVTNISGDILYSNEWSISTGYKGVLLIIKI